MKKFWIKVAAVALAGVMTIGLAGCAKKTDSTATGGADASASSGPKVTLKMSYALPKGGFQGTTYEYFAKTVNEESNGEIEVKTYPAGSLVSDPEILDAVMKGNVDIGHFAISYVTPTIKELTPFEVPGAYPASKYKEFEKATHPMVEKIFAKYGVHYLGSLDVESMSFSANKKVGKLIKTPADTQGQPIRVAGKWGGEAVKIWGGSPVTIPIGDLSTALERGTASVAYTGWVITEGFKLYEQAPNVTFTDLQELFQGMIMSDKAWNSLSKEQQDAVTRAAAKWMDYANKNVNERKVNFQKKLKDQNIPTYVLTDEENAEFKKATAQLLEQVKPLSGPEGEELVNIFASIK